MVPPTKAELEKARSPKSSRIRRTRSSSGSREPVSQFASGMQKKGLHKEFLDEIAPLCAFAELEYPDTYKVSPIIGNQGYDAIVYDEFQELQLTDLNSRGPMMALGQRQMLGLP